MPQNFIVELFEFHWHIHFQQDFILMGLFFSELLLWFIEYVAKLYSFFLASLGRNWVRSAYKPVQTSSTKQTTGSKSLSS